MKPHEHIILEVARERERQMTEEGWTPEHDDTHDKGELALVASCYAEHASRLPGARKARETGRWCPGMWPWSRSWWKPTTARRDLVKAAALIIAEIERLDRAETRKED